ncbi:anti-silencing protein 1 [Heterostelium album PN500]|uniref:Anti-silencing protein 1 n=1 Tax=Heterostelium pallidum (strain ATCC 26659 / Pp 5 / PN500) TaxID=670386 RepID=D3BJI9_HETP5|nr:anti-silencing protein 1 [Heterostelium album PN500]EFA78069.1 anti-silencing protein 1 [Heterostelium album PN500]|eukprot:XP_020430196.1 anti-silencing protein 1 [Heterostelium album PN500]
MSHIKLTQVLIHNNPANFDTPLIFDISFECISPIKEELEWKVVYVGSADSEKNDQLLDSILLDPVSVGTYQFVFEVDPPDSSRIPKDDLLGVTVVFLICAYKGRDFIRLGYYVSNSYCDQELIDVGLSINYH